MDDLLLKIFRYFNNWKRSKLVDIFLQRSSDAFYSSLHCFRFHDAAFETVLASWQVEITAVINFSAPSAFARKFVNVSPGVEFLLSRR